jgi:FkbM family methyltransferase
MSIAARFNTIKQITNHPLNRNRRLGAFFDYFRWNIGLRLLQAEYILPLAGDANIVVSSRQNFATLLYTCGLWDFPEMMFLLHLLRPADRFVDIGSNVGAYSILASAVAGARSIAFEPIPLTYDELVRNINLNEIEDRVEARRICLGSSNGNVRMTADLGGLNHVVTDRDRGASVDTEIMRLDDAIGAEACRFMKIDAEGYEAEILAGAETVLGNSALLGLIVELNDSGLRYGFTNDAVHETLVRFGFRTYDYDARGRTLRPTTSYSLRSLNTLYLRDIPTILDRLADAPGISVRGETI